MKQLASLKGLKSHNKGLCSEKHVKEMIVTVTLMGRHGNQGNHDESETKSQQHIEIPFDRNVGGLEQQRSRHSRISIRAIPSNWDSECLLRTLLGKVMVLIQKKSNLKTVDANILQAL
jgi:hypothetical protein